MTRRPSKKKNIWHAVAHLLFTVVALLGIGIAWLAMDVRSLEFLKPYVQESVSDAFAPFSVEAGDIRYTIDRKDWTLVTGLRNVTLKDEENHRVATFSRINLDLRLLSLLSGEIRFQTLEVVKPSIRLTKQEDGRVTLSVSARKENEENEEEAPADIEIGGVVGALKEISVKTVVVRDAFLGIASRNATAMYRLPRLMLMAKEHGDIFSIQYDAQIQESEEVSRVTGSFDINESARNFSATSVFSDFNLILAAPFHPYGAYFADAAIRLSGTTSVAMDFDGKLLKASADIMTENGNYAHPEFFPKRLTYRSIALKAHKEKDDPTLHIEKASLENDDMALAASGDVSFLPEGIGVKAEAEVKNLKIDRVGDYWPLDMSKDARDWVTTNLSVGTVASAKAKLAFTPEDLAAEETPESLLDADLVVKGATVGFLPGYPTVKGVNGKVKITAKALDIVADSGDFMRGTKLEAAHLRIPDFAAPGIPMAFSLTLDAPAADVAEMIGEKRLNLASALRLDPDAVEGAASGKVDFTLPLYSAEWPKEKPYITYDITAKLNNVSQDGVLGKWNITGMGGDLAVDNSKLTLNTVTELQGVGSELGIAREFTGAKTTTYTLVADIPRETMPVFGFDIPEQIQGILGVNAKVTETGDKSVTQAKVNLSNTAIRIDELNYTKQLGKPATLQITQESKGNRSVVPQFSYGAEGAEVKGSYTQDKKSGEFTEVKLSRLKLGANDFALSYATGEAGRRLITLSGQTLDLSTPEPEEGVAKAPKKEDDGNPLDALLNSRITLDLKKLLLSPAHGLNHLSGVIDCGVHLCPGVSLKSETGEGVPFTFTIGQEEGRRKLTMASKDAGGVIKSFDISDHVVGGVLDFKGTFDDSGAQPVLNGRLLVTDFRVVKGPILAKLLSLASLTGFLDTLAGNGISFAKLSADAIFSGDMLRVKNGKAYGSAIGLTVKGKIQPFKGTIDLNGTVVPAYAANSIIGKIPLLGTILTGGDGGGVIAANYTMKGSGEDPEVSVNPLSLLTPGFLRNVFDAPEEDDDHIITDTAPEEKTEETTPAEEKPAFPTVRKR